MNNRNIIVLIGNGFDIANGFKTRFSDFANNYLEKRIIPELKDLIENKDAQNTFFRKNFVLKMAKKSNAFDYDIMEDALWLFVQNDQDQKLKEYLENDYKVIRFILQNSLLGLLYSDTDKNWFDIENTYFKELIKLKNSALKTTRAYDIKPLQRLNKDFYEIKTEVLKYLKSIETEVDKDILGFLIYHFEDVKNVYFVNFNYTNTLQLYTNLIPFQGNYKVNHIHGDLKTGNIVFGYGNDQNQDYQEIKSLEIDEFLRYFKTFDYLNNENYDKINEEAVDKFTSYEVYILGHSLGLTDKTLLSEIMNNDKCRKIRFFKRTDLHDHPSLIKSNYRELTYSASRILTNEKQLRRKILNFENSTTFP